MKQANNDRTNVLKGVSTLDEFCKNSRIALLFLIITAFVSSIYGGHSILDLVDPSFNPQIQANSFAVKQVNAIVPVAGGKVLYGGFFNSYNRQPTGKLIRLNADATLDTTFNNNVLVASSFVNQILLQADGKILVRGVSLTLNGQTTPGKAVVRLNADGTPDTTFNYTEADSLSDAALDASGRILLCGLFPESSSVNRAVIRLNTDGSLDSSFRFVTNQSVERIIGQNNKAVISFGAPPTIYRLDESGNFDASFIPVTPSGHPMELLVQPDNKILLLTFRSLLRLNENGGADNSFTPQNIPMPDFGQTMFLAQDGKITFSYGWATFKIKRILNNGADDNSFTPYDASFYGAFGLEADGGVLIGDIFNGGNVPIQNHFVHLLPNGSLDASFNTGGIGFQSINPSSIGAITILANGKIMLGGKFDLVNDSLRFKIARLNADSTLDTTFQVSLDGAGNTFTQIHEIYNIAAQTDGKLLVSGHFTYRVNGATKTNFVRLNPDGSIDSTFVLNVLLNDSFGCCGGGKAKSAALSDGKIIFGGSRRTLKETPVPVKLNSDGTRDTSFNSAAYPSATLLFIHDTVVQPDGKIIIGGRYDIFSSNTLKSFVARLNADGSIDSTFQVNEQAGKEVAALSLLPNGKILLVKGNQYNEPIQQSNVFRLNADGSPDSSFDAGTGANGRINTILLLPTGKMFVGGKFTSFNGQARQNLAQLNANGSLNKTTYNLNEEVLSLAVDGDGRVLVGGNFTIIEVDGSGGSTRTYLARLIDSKQVKPTRFDFDGDGKADIGVFSSLNRTWSILNSQTNQPILTQFGLGSDKIAPADFDGDGRADIAVYRPSEGNWYLLRSTDGFGVVRFGAGGDRPVPADYDGDGKADIAIWRPGVGDWWVLPSSNGQAYTLHFGLLGDTPLTDTDFDGDGKADIAVWRPSDGNFYWMASGSNNQVHVVHWGMQGDIPAPADYNGDGKADLVVFRPSEGNWYQFLTMSNGDYTYSVTRFGLEGDEPVAADYDGDGKTDIALRRNGVWHLMLSGQGYTVVTFGNPAAQAIPALPWEVTIAATEELPDK